MAVYSSVLLRVVSFLSRSLDCISVMHSYIKGMLGKQYSLIERLVRGAAGKSLAQPTTRCHGTESIVSLERRVCSCAELQVVSYYRG